MNARANHTEIATGRYAELKQILEDRRREILSEVQEKMRDVRAVGASGEGVLDAAETSEADIQDDIELALIQMKSETLHKIEEALKRLDEGPTATASSAVTRFPSGACARCLSRFAARTARRPGRLPSSASGSNRSGVRQGFCSI